MLGLRYYMSMSRGSVTIKRFSVVLFSVRLCGSTCVGAAATNSDCTGNSYRECSESQHEWTVGFPWTVWRLIIIIIITTALGVSAAAQCGERSIHGASELLQDHCDGSLLQWPWDSVSVTSNCAICCPDAATARSPPCRHLLSIKQRIKEELADYK